MAYRPKDRLEPPGCKIGFLPLETMWKIMLRELTTTRPPATSGGLPSF